MYIYPNSNYYDNDLREILNLYHKVTSDYNDLKRFIDNIDSIIDPKVNSAVNKAVAPYLDKFIEIQKTIEVLKLYIDDSIDQLKLYIDTQDSALLSKINNNFSRLSKDLMDTYKLLIDFMERANEWAMYLDMRIDDIYTLLGDNKGVLYNPITGLVGKQNTVWLYVINALRSSHALNCAEFAKATITAGHIGNALITCKEWSVDSKRLVDNRYYNPYTGRRDDMQGILSCLKDGYLAIQNGRYKDLQISVNDIKDSNIVYSDFNKNALIYNNRGIVVLDKIKDSKYLSVLNGTIAVSSYSADNNVAIYHIIYNGIIDSIQDITCVAIKSVDGTTHNLTDVTVDMLDRVIEIIIPAELYNIDISINIVGLCYTQSLSD